ncbi:DegT/DnrJ/EryC1/StrS family aminotransferase [Candidatus Bipolaricaulota bacterium]
MRDTDSGMHVPLVDPARQHRTIISELRSAFEEVVDAGTYVLGPRLRTFEESIASYHQVPHAVGVNSCTDALFLALKALQIGPGDEVIVPATTFVATASTVVFCGAKPVFAEVEEDTLNLDAAQLRAAISPATKAIIVVHFHGHPANLDPILSIAKEESIPVVEDCAQAFGAEYSGRKVGGLSTIGCLSFYPTKILGAIGDGGMVITCNEHLSGTVRSLRNYGETQKYVYDRIGFNSRLDELQAALLQVKLRYVDSWIAKRRALADRYNDLLADLPLVYPIQKDYARHSYWVYTVRLTSKSTRAAVQNYLSEKGIGTHVFYPICVPDQKPFKSAQDPFRISREAADRMLALPFSESLAEHEQDYVVKCLKEALELT